jgi:hypothetical protein
MLMPLRCAFVVSAALPTTDFGPAAVIPDTGCSSTAVIADCHNLESSRQ